MQLISTPRYLRLANVKVMLYTQANVMSYDDFETWWLWYADVYKHKIEFLSYTNFSLP